MKWIHISDLHYNPEQSSLYTKMGLDKLNTFIMDNNIVADHLFVTGDFRHALEQKDQPIDKVVENVVEYVLSVAKDSNIPNANIHIVPGNHDLDRCAKDDTENLSKINDMREVYIKNKKKIATEDMQYLNGSFDFFWRVCEEFKKKNPEMCIPWLENKNQSIHVKFFDEFSVIYINTCLFCHSDDAKVGKLYIDTNLLYECVKKIKEKKNHLPVIILAHHEVDTLNQDNKKDFVKILSGLRNPIVYLCGDAHDTWENVENSILEVTAGCLLQAEGTQMTFSVGEIINRIIDTISVYSCKKGTWKEDPHISDSIAELLSSVKKVWLKKDNSSFDGEPMTKNFGRSITEQVAKNKLVTSRLKECQKNPERYFDILSKPYGLLVTDITGVLFDNENGTEIFPDEIIDVFAELARKHVSICFTTGRGRSGARNLLFSLAQQIIDTYSDLKWESLSNEWVCLTHNGVYVLTTPDKSKSGFLANAEPLFPQMLKIFENQINKESLERDFNTIIKRYANRNSTLEKPVISVSYEPASIRFSIEHWNAADCDRVFNILQKKFNDSYRHTDRDWFYIRGLYQNKEMFEISLVNKADAVREYIRRYRSIDNNNIIRLADRGKEKESDHLFLAEGPSTELH